MIGCCFLQRLAAAGVKTAAAPPECVGYST
jgi:hypothetical protein